jgi:hypothetical protein
MIFPKLFARILACDALEDLGTAWVFVYESYLELLLALSFHKPTLALCAFAKERNEVVWEWGGGR